MKNWESKYHESLNTLYEFISVKVKLYDGGRPVFNSFKENVRFFHIENGDIVLGSELQLGISILRKQQNFYRFQKTGLHILIFQKLLLHIMKRIKVK